MAIKDAIPTSRSELYDEFHRREPMPVSAGIVCTHLTLRRRNDSGTKAHNDLNALCDALDITRPPAGTRQLISAGPSVRFKWERHTEFCSYTFYHQDDVNALSTGPLDSLPPQWRNSICEDDILAAVKVAIIASDSNDDGLPENIARVFSPNTVAMGTVCDDHAIIASDCKLNDRGCVRIAIIDKGLAPRRAGRLLQRLLDIESYRIASMLGFNVAHPTNAAVDAIEADLHALMDDRGFHADEAPDRELLDRLLRLASRTEHLLSQTSFRFDATRAYANIVLRRMDELSEKRIQGAQRLTNFLKRRFIPAIDTTAAASTRLRGLSERIHRDAALIRTRIDVIRQEQNSNLLDSMDRRAHAQFKLQQTVESISIVAISYYAISIFAVFAKMAAKIWPSLNASILTGIAAPVIILGVVWLTKQISKSL